MEMKKKDFIKLLDKIDDEQYIDLWLDCEGDNENKPIIISWPPEEIDIIPVYKAIVDAIADYARSDWQCICEAIRDLYYCRLLGKVKKVHPEVRNDKIYYRIDKEEITNGMYETAFAPSSGYWVKQITVYEDSYRGQMLIPLGDEWMVVEYAC